MLEIERGSTRSHSVKNSFWRRLWTVGKRHDDDEEEEKEEEKKEEEEKEEEEKEEEEKEEEEKEE